MESQPETNPAEKEGDFLQSMFQNDTVWFINAHEDPDNGEEMRPFDSI